MKACSFLHAHFTDTIKIVENLFLKSLWCTAHVLKSHMLYGHIGITSKRQFQFVPTTYVTENKKRKTILKFTFISSIMHVNCLYLF